MLSTNIIAASGGVGELLDSFGVKWPLLVAQIVNFCVVTYLLYRFALKPIQKTVDERQKAIADGLQYAEEMRLQLEDSVRQRTEMLKKATQEAQHVLQEAREQSQLQTERQKKEAERQAELLLQKTRLSLEQEKGLMMQAVKKEVAQLIVDTTQQLLEEDLSEEKKKSLNERASQKIYMTQ